jgi:hypothetical protein
MAAPHGPHHNEVFQEHPMVVELLAELQVLEEQRQCAVRFHQLMNQYGPLDLPVQYERLFRRSPAGQEEKKDDDRRRTHKGRRRRLPHARG